MTTSEHPNYWFIAAGLLMASCAGIHAFLGGPEINAPVQAADLDPVVRSVMDVVWHALTGLFLIFGAALIWISRSRNIGLFWTILATNGFFIALFLAIGVAMLGSITLMPQWTLFAAISALMLLGLRRA